jgi:hypothetical protein
MNFSHSEDWDSDCGRCGAGLPRIQLLGGVEEVEDEEGLMEE